MRIDVRRFDRALCGDQREVAGGHIGLGEVTRMDARTGDDPFVAGLDALAGETFSQILIGDAPGRQVAAGAQHAGINCRLSHYAFEDCAA